MYVLDEEKVIVNGVWEGFLDHQEVNLGSILIYTGEKLTGTRLTGYSVVSDWGKTKIRLSAPSGKVYITYEALSETPSPVVVKEVTTTTPPENEKADKVYVDMELMKKADKVSTFTKQEVLKKIEENGGNISIIDGGSFV